MGRDLLARAEELSRTRGLQDMLVIDADVHHLDVIKRLGPYMEHPWRRTVEEAARAALRPNDVGDRRVAGRIKRPATVLPEDDTGAQAVRKLAADLARMGVDYSVVFPNDMLVLGLHPQPAFEVAVARGYARWLTEVALPSEPRMMALLYLPFSDPEASLQIIEEFGDKDRIVGGLVTGLRRERIHDNRYVKVYRALEERNLLLGFHSTGYWPAYPYRMFDSFLAAHALSFPFYNAIHLVNIILNGIPDRFPRLRLAFFEAGAAVIPMLMARLDTGFLMRSSEAPRLQRLPSEYMREFFYTIQPIEHPDVPGQMEAIFDQIGRSQIMFASDYPHWDFDMPNSITQLGFLSAEDKRNILALNAVRAFGLDPSTLTLTDQKRRPA